MKSSALTRIAAAGRTPHLDGQGRWIGTYIAPHSIPADRMNVRELSAITAMLGTVYSGTMYAGEGQGLTQLGARVAIGQAVKGIQIRGSDGRNCLEETWVGPYFRWGYPDEPNIEFVDGTLRVHGGCVVDGTLTASKIVLGDAWVRTMLAGGVLAIGTGDGETPDNPADPFSGFRVSHKTASASGKGTVWQRRAKAAGFYEGAMTFAIDTATGEFLSLGADESEDTYISLKQGVWTIANDETVPNGAGVTKLLFRTKHQSFGTEMVSDFYMHGSPSGLILYRPNTMQQPAIELWMDREEGGVTTRQVVTRYGCEILHMAVIPYARDPNWFDIWVRGDAVWLSTMRRRLVVQADLETEDGDVKIAGAQRWIQNSAGEWPALPDAGPAERILMPDSTTGDLKYWNGTAWTTVTTS